MKISFVVPLIIVSLWGCNGKEVTEESTVKDDSKPMVKASYRSGVSPNGTFEVLLERLPVRPGNLYDITDKGTLFFKPSVTKAEYYITQGGKDILIQKPARNVYPHLKPDGTFMFTKEGPDGLLRLNSYYPDRQDGADGLFFNDDSFLTIHTAKSPDRKTSTYSIQREWHQTGPEFDGDLIREKLVKSEMIYQANHTIYLLDKTDSGVIWIQDHTVIGTRRKDKLIRFENRKTQEVSLPTGYENIQRLAQTNEQVAATFGVLHGQEPIRGFRLDKDGWHELPIPPGFEFSFVQKVFTDGTILGFVCNPEMTKISTVMWKEDKLAILDGLPGWPKRSNLPIIELANRSGLVCINDHVGTQYLVQIKAK